MMIRVSHITKRFGRVAAVDDASFTLEAGSSLALWGSNGAGKTTLIRCLLGVIRFRGSITVGGLDVRRLGKQSRALIGYVPQELAFHDDARLGDAMSFFAGLRGVPLSRAAELLESVALAGHERRRVRDLSGGMKQRLALAIALLADPPIIVLDEPTSNLDASGRGEVVERLRGLRSSGKTLLFASHRPDEVLALADRTLVMEQGRVVRDTTPGELWPAGSASATMRLHVEGGLEEAAARVLREAGHPVNLNGHGLCVSTPRHRKGEPIGALERAAIPVRDFELLDDLGPREAIP